MVNVSPLDFDSFLRSVKAINAKLADEKAHDALLAEARADSPCIAGVLQELSLLHEMPPSAEVQKGITLAHRDLVVLLALRAVEKTRGLLHLVSKKL